MININKTYVDVSKLSPNPLQPRGQILLDSIQELIASIKEHGVLEPLIIAETPAGLQIIAGERRWRAAIAAGLKQVPAVVKKTTREGMLEMAIVENVQRTNLNPIERGVAYKRMIDDFGFTLTDVAKRVSKSLPLVCNAIRLLELPDAVKDGLISGAVSDGHGKILVGLEDANLILEAYKEILKHNLSVHQTEDLIRKVKSREFKKSGKFEKGSKRLLMYDDIGKLIERLEKKIPAKFSIRRNFRVTRIVISIHGTVKNTDETFQRICTVLEGVH